MDALFPILAIAWYGSGFWGLILLWKKNRLKWFTNLGCTTWILFGWIAGLVLLCVPLALGPVMLLMGRKAEDRSAEGRSVAPTSEASYTPRRK